MPGLLSNVGADCDTRECEHVQRDSTTSVRTDVVAGAIVIELHAHPEICLVLHCVL
jgi:hypothetical protein